LNQIKSNKKSSKNESTSSSPSRIIIPSIIQKLVDHSVHRSKKKKIIETVETTPAKSNLITNSEVASHETMSIEHETVNNQERSKDTNHKISVNSTLITETEENMKTLESKSSGAKNIISGFLKALWK